MRKDLLLILLALLAVACHRESDAELTAEYFMAAYLDCRFSEASRMASPLVVEQMRWRASQLTEADVALLAETAAEVTVADVAASTDSSIVTLSVSQALLPDSLGRPWSIGSCRYRLVLKRPDGKRWQVVSLRSL